MADLPDKLYYSIREIAEHTGVEPHVLRYWETEFPTLRPKRARSGARTYRRRDVEEIQLIRRLLHEEGYRIEGARKFLRERRQPQETPETTKTRPDMFAAQDRNARLQGVREGLREVLGLLAAMKEPGSR